MDSQPAMKSDPPIDTATIRRGALFLVNIGAPVIVGVARHETEAALLGAVIGMILAFADNDGALSGRLRLLAVDALALAAGGLVGYLFCRHAERVFWPLFVVLTFAVALAARHGREPLLAGRHCAVAFIVAAGIPAFQIFQLWYLAGVFLLCAVSRTIDHLLFGPLPRLPAAPLQTPSDLGGWLRFAVCFAVTACAGLLIGDALGELHRYWIAITTIMVMQADAKASYRRIVERIAGTFAGVIVAWGITAAFHSAAVVCAAIVIVAPLIPHHVNQRYWLHTGLIALMVLLAYDLTLLGSAAISRLLLERLTDILLGCAIALVGTAAAFPRTTAAELDSLAGDGGKER